MSDLISKPPSGGEPGPGDASTVHFLLLPDVAELSALRAEMAPWLSGGAGHAGVADRALLVAHELGLMAIETAAPGPPIQVQLRRTHSILVIEVTFEPSAGADVADLNDLAPDDLQLEVRIVDQLSDRLATENGGRRVTLRSTFHLPPLP